jgi:hypothetical protein
MFVAVIESQWAGLGAEEGMGVKTTGELARWFWEFRLIRGKRPATGFTYSLRYEPGALL